MINGVLTFLAKESIRRKDKTIITHILWAKRVHIIVVVIMVINMKIVIMKNVIEVGAEANTEEKEIGFKEI